MAFRDSYFTLLDNTGAKIVKCIYSYESKIIKPGGIILVTVKQVLPHRKVKKGQLFKAVVVRLCKTTKRLNGLCVKYYENSVVLLKKTELVPLGTRIFGSVFIEIRRKGFMKIITLSAFTL